MKNITDYHLYKILIFHKSKTQLLRIHIKLWTPIFVV